jgi:hypothetical protein
VNLPTVEMPARLLSATQAVEERQQEEGTFFLHRPPSDPASPAVLMRGSPRFSDEPS